MKPTYREKNLLDYLFGGFRSTLNARRHQFYGKKHETLYSASCWEGSNPRTGTEGSLGQDGSETGGFDFFLQSNYFFFLFACATILARTGGDFFVCFHDSGDLQEMPWSEHPRVQTGSRETKSSRDTDLVYIKSTEMVLSKDNYRIW